MSYTGWVTYRRMASGAWAIVAEDGACVGFLPDDPDIIDINGEGWFSNES